MKVTDFKNIVHSIFFVMMLIFFLTMLLCVSIFSESLIDLRTSKINQLKKLAYQKVLLEERFIFEETMSISSDALKRRFSKISSELNLVGTKIHLSIEGECYSGDCLSLNKNLKQKKLQVVETAKEYRLIYRVYDSTQEYGLLQFVIPQQNFEVRLSLLDQTLLYMIPFLILLITWMIWFYYIERKIVSPFISKLVSTERAQAILKVTNQVAHDIKSPLSALEIVMEDIKNLPEESRELTLHAINRIQDIANNLSKDRNSQSNSECSHILISPLISSVVNEKRVEYQSCEKLDIILTDYTDKCRFLKVNESDIARSISNIINNSVEALCGEGCIQIDLYFRESNVCIRILDSGSGFPEGVLSRGIEKGNTQGKTNGQGLGLYYAKTTVDHAGGEISLSNPVDGGANILISIPIAKSPKWFKSSLNISNFKSAVIIDDDKSIHEVWKKLLNKKQSIVKIEDFYSTFNAEKKLQNIDLDELVLIDYDLRSDTNGIDLIEKYNLKNACLVTSNYDEDEVLDYCIENSIQLIPKQIVASIELI